MTIPSTRYYTSCIDALKENLNFDLLPDHEQQQINEQLNKLEVSDEAINLFITANYYSDEEKIFKRAEQIVKLKNAIDKCEKQKTGNELIDLRDIVLNKGVYFLDQNGDYFAKVYVDNHFEIMNLDSEKFSQYCVRIWETEVDQSKLVSNESIKKVSTSLKSRIKNRLILETRCAELNGNIYYDLCDENWNQVKITKKGWSIINDSPVCFRRSSTTAKQCMPELNGDLSALDKFLNLSENNKILFKSIIPALFLSNLARPIILPFGEEGSGKTILSWLMKDLIDPTTIEKQDFPSDELDYDLICEREYLPLFDNVHKLPSWAEDALSTTVTGRSTVKRKLYTNKDIVATTFKRAIIINGIDIPIKNSDCLQRTLLVKTQPIVETERTAENRYKSEYYAHKQKILGAIFDVIVKILENKEKYQIQTRLKEFASAAVVSCVNQGYTADQITSFYHTLQDEQNNQSREASPIWDELILLADRGFEGTTQELGIELANRLNSLPKTTIEKIKNSQWLGTHLSRLQRQLRYEGILWEENRQAKTGKRKKTLKRVVTLSPNSDVSTINKGDNISKDTLSPVVTLSPCDNPVTSSDKPNSNHLSPYLIDDKHTKGDKVTTISGQKSQEQIFVDFVRRNGGSGGGSGRAVLVDWLGDEADDVIAHYLSTGVIFENEPDKFKLLE